MDNYFNIQCLNGHIWREHPDSPLGLRAKTHREDGYIDALTVLSKECDQCKDEREHQDRLNREFCDWPDEGSSKQSLSDQVRDEEWFNNHPEDMLPK